MEPHRNAGHGGQAAPGGTDLSGLNDISRPGPARRAAIAAFVDAAGWDPGQLAGPASADASSRSYIRLRNGGETVLLMDAPPGLEGPVCPPGANPATRRRLGYNAMTRLAASRVDAFCAIADLLRRHGVRAPRIPLADPELGVALIEDFGDTALAAMITRGGDEQGLYGRALAAIAPLAAVELAPTVEGGWPLQTYDDTALHAELDVFLDWYLPRKGIETAPEHRESFHAAWGEVFGALSPRRTLVLRDYHAENILVPDTGGLGVIDFQDAVIGHGAYDVASLLEDVRRDIDARVLATLIDAAAAHSPSRSDFLTDYAILAAQRNMRILGVFARLVSRDGKTRYEDFVPRTRRYLRKDLLRPELEPVARWVSDTLPGLLDKDE